TFGDAILAARALVERGARRVLASFGSAGAILVDSSSVIHAIANCDQVQSTVGAGDALLAGFLAADDSAEGALRQAVEWAAQSVATPANGIRALDQAIGSTGAVIADIDPARRLHVEPAPARLLVGEVAAGLD